jgi:hypothetical protein
MSPEPDKKRIDTYYMARSRWGRYVMETSGGSFTTQRIIGERFLTKGGAARAIARYLDQWRDKFPAGERPELADFKIVKVTVRR